MIAEAAGRGPDFLAVLEQAARQADVYSPDDSFPGESSLPKLRRRGRPEAEDAVGTLLLIESDGILRWSDWAEAPVLPGRYRRGGRGGTGAILAQLKFARLAPSQIGEFLSGLDLRLTPNQGLRRLQNGTLHAVTRPGATGRALLLLHGTFSNTENLLEELGASPAGRELLGRAESAYDEVLAFDHPTLSVSPLLNALDLADLFRGCPASLDVICHSRGGLVARWWLETLRGELAAQDRVVLVGCPLAGTGLAAAPRLRAALNLLTNLGRALTVMGGLASAAVPFLTVASGLMRVFSSLTGFAAKTPLLDAGVALVPGLAGQARVGNNPEILRLRRRAAPASRYFAVRSNFEPQAPGWAFWRRFRAESLADLGADAVFEGENDLVVDTSSMTELADATVIPTSDVLDFGTSEVVHHTNYFRQQQTVEFLARVLQIP